MSEMGDLVNMDSTVKTGTYGNWAQFWSIARLNIVIQGTPENEVSKIYGNSRNMVEAVITIEIVDQNGDNLNVTDDELKNQLYFCSFETGEDLTAIWLTSNEPNEYVSGTRSFSAEFSDRRIIRKYLSCKIDKQVAEKVSVGLNVPGFGKFDTSRYGTTTLMGSGGIFKSPKACEVIAIRPIDYSIRENVTIGVSERVDVKTGIKWESRLLDWPYAKHYNSIVDRRFATIRPNQAVTNEVNFKKYELVYEPVKNSDVSKGTVWWSNYTSPTEPSFTLFKEDGGFDRPCAVIGSGLLHDGNPSAHYEVNLWYPRKSLVGINGNFHVSGSDYLYRFNGSGNTISNNHSNDDEHGAVTLVLYKCILPVTGLWKWKFDNCIRDITVKVTDVHGNEGSIKLNFNETDKFNIPGIK